MAIYKPVLLSLNTQPVSAIVTSHGIQHHKYADDITLYVSYNPSSTADVSRAKLQMEQCVDSISGWMGANCLKLNASKTELLNAMSPHHLRTYGQQALSICGTTIHPSSSVTCLGVVLDTHLTMSSQVTAIVKTCNFHLRNISKIRNFITADACKDAVCTMIQSRLDYCCSLLVGITQHDLHRLQRIQNSAACLVTRTASINHITPVLRELHWLPCHLRIEFRVLVFVYMCVNNCAPVYLRELVRLHIPVRSLRSSHDCLRLDSHLLPQKRVGDKAFGMIAPRIWNQLPFEVRCAGSKEAFKRALKYYFFNRFYV